MNPYEKALDEVKLSEKEKEQLFGVVCYISEKKPNMRLIDMVNIKGEFDKIYKKNPELLKK